VHLFVLPTDEGLERSAEAGFLLEGPEGLGEPLDLDEPSPRQTGKTGWWHKPAPEIPSALAIEVQVIHGFAHAGIGFHAVGDGAAGVEHRAVVASPEGFADGAEGGFGQGAGQEHGHLPREGDVIGAAAAEDVSDAEVEVIGDAFDDDIDGEGCAAFLAEDVAQQVAQRVRR
jgi:hypothetical protein